MDTCICMAESLCCVPEAISALLVDYTPIQDKKLKPHIWVMSQIGGVQPCLLLHIQSHGPRLCSCALVRDEAGVPVFWPLE